jgi:hypothetical protein
MGIKKNPPQSVWIKKNPYALRGTLFSTHALRGIKNKKTGYYYKIKILKSPPRHLSPSKHGDLKEYPQSTGTVKSPPQSMGTKKSTPLWGVSALLPTPNIMNPGLFPAYRG